MEHGNQPKLNDNGISRDRTDDLRPRRWVDKPLSSRVKMGIELIATGKRTGEAAKIAGIGANWLGRKVNCEPGATYLRQCLEEAKQVRMDAMREYLHR